MKKENSTNSINAVALRNFCNAHNVLSEITGRWKVSIIFSLEEDKKLYSEFKLILPDITDRVLSKQLSELKENDIIENDKNKTQSNYFLTEKGKKILNLLKYINQLDL
ncbi:helix-turn-helix domain-containing protein [Chishuiella sp.]|uniref:winged helix-turn-helix transcriptional regulator n=1 Tax=Chishuiella sp. TaxID=1969467 RepID=UPI0028B1C455|nr:helix-turn-helix domain-containing protein [Chishuiella sp.]